MVDQNLQIKNVIIKIMKCLVTICAKKKDGNPELLPAYLRYLAPHIEQTHTKAKKLNIPFYILSGKYGLVPANEEISDYDYYLEKEKVEDLSDLMAEQIKKLGITEIDFYFEEKESWKPYISALEKASIKAEYLLNKEIFLENPSEIKMR